MKKLLLITIFGIFCLDCFCQFTGTFKKVRTDTIAGLHDTVWVSNETGSKGYYLTRNDTLYFYDAGGFKSLAKLVENGTDTLRVNDSINLNGIWYQSFATVAGNDREINFNDNGSFGASPNLKFKNDTLYVNGDVYITTGSCFVDTSGVIYYLDSDGMYLRNLNTNNSIYLGDAGIGLSIIAADNEINLDAQTYIEYESSIDHLFTINSDSVLKLNDDSVIFYRNAQTPFDWTLYGYNCGYLTFDRNQTIETYRNVLLRTYNSSNGAQLLLIDDTGGGKEASLYVLNSGSKQNGVYIDVNKVRIGSAYSTAMADFTTSLIDFNISTEIDGSLGVTDTSVYNISYVQIDGDSEYEHAQAAVHPATANAAIYTAINIPQIQFGNTVIIKQITVFYNTTDSGDDWDFHLYSSDNDGTITSHIDIDDIGNGSTGNASINLLSADLTLTDYSYTMEFDVNNTNLDTDVLFYNIRVVHTNK